MKKLMFAMMAVASFALTAKAEDPTLSPAMDFSQYKDVPCLLDVNADDAGGATGTRYWTSNTNTTYVGKCEVQKDDGGNQFLFVDTENTQIIQRRVAPPTAGENTPVKIPTLPGGMIVVTNKVSFSGSDTAPTPEQVDKILIWAKYVKDESGAVTATNLAVTSAMPTGGSQVTDTNFAIDEGAWYDLVIETSMAKEDQAQFHLIIKPSGSTDEPSKFGPYLSMNNASGYSTMTTVGYTGNGKVDDISFGYVAGQAIETVTLTFNITKGEADVVEVAKAPDMTAYIVSTPAVTGTAEVEPNQEFTFYVQASDGETPYEEGVISVLPAGVASEMYDAESGIWVMKYTPTAAATITITCSAQPGPTPKPAPGQPAEYDSEDAATAAAAAINAATGADKVALVNLPDGLTDAQKTTLVNYVKATASGKEVSLSLQDDSDETLQKQANADAAAALTPDAEGNAEFATVAGLWYSIATGTDLAEGLVEGDRTMATSDKMTIKVIKSANDKSRFYKVIINLENKAAE